MVFSELTAKLSLDSSGFQSGVDNARQSLGKLSEKAADVGKSMQGAGKKLSAGVTAPIVGAAGASAKAAADFDQSMQESIAVMGDVDEEMRDKLEGTARDVATSMSVSHEEAAESFYYLSSAGLDAAESMKAMPQVAQFAEAGQMDMAEATDVATNVMSAFGYEAAEMTEVTDTMTATVSNHNQTMEGMSNAMEQVAPVASALGFELEETSAAVGMLGDVGIQGEKAGTALRNVFSSLSDETSTASQKLEEMGVKTRDSEGNLLSFSEILDNMRESGVEAGDAARIFGKEAGPAMAELLAQGGDALEENTERIDEMEGATEDVAETQRDTLNAELDILKSRVRDAAISFGEILIPVLNDLVDRLKPVAEWFGSLSDRQRKIIVVAAAAAAALGPLLFIVGTFLTVLPALVAGFGAVATAIGVLLSPIGLLVLAAGALYYAWRTNLFGIRDVTKDAFEAVTDAVGNALDTLQGWASDLKDAFPSTFEEAIDAVKRVFLKWHPYGILWDKREEMFAALPDYEDFETLGHNLVVGLANGFYGAVNTVRDAAGWLWDWVWSGVPSWGSFKSSGKALVTGLVNGLYAKAGYLKRGTSWVKDWVKSAVPDWEYFKQKGKNMIQGLINGIYAKAGKFRDAIQYIADIADRNTNDSDADEGPLQNTSDWGKAFPETFAEGIAANSGTVREASRGMAGEAAPGTAAGGAGGGGAGAGGDRVVVELNAGDEALDALFDAIDPHVETKIRRREQSQNRRSKRLNTRRE